MKLSAGRVELLIWVLIYGGMLGFGFGFALTRGGQSYGWGVCAVGVAAAIVGSLLIWVRSRMADRSDA